MAFGRPLKLQDLHKILNTWPYKMVWLCEYLMVWAQLLKALLA